MRETPTCTTSPHREKKVRSRPDDHEGGTCETTTLKSAARSRRVAPFCIRSEMASISSRDEKRYVSMTIAVASSMIAYEWPPACKSGEPPTLPSVATVKIEE